MRRDFLSVKLDRWLSSDGPKNLQGLRERFGAEALLCAILVLMSVPALPLPTGGITHVFEIIALLLAIEFTAGGNFWLPRAWSYKPLPSGVLHRVLPRLMKGIRWYETRMQPWGERMMRKRFSVIACGLTLSVCIAAAFLAPPFSGLDTLPALGAVLLCFALLVRDVRLVLLGCVVGSVGIGLEVVFGAVLWNVLRTFV